MAEDLIPILTRFHREIVLPDMQRIVDERITASEARQNAHFDAIYKRFAALEDEYQAIRSGLKRLEERMDGVEQRLGRVEDGLDGVEQRLGRVEDRLGDVEQKLTKQDAQAELATLKARVDVLQGQIRQLEDRLSA